MTKFLEVILHNHGNQIITLKMMIKQSFFHFSLLNLEKQSLVNKI